MNSSNAVPRYLTPRGEYEVAGQLVTLDVRAEVDAQLLWLRTRQVWPVTAIELSRDAYEILYLQVRDMRGDKPMPFDMSRYCGVPIRRVSGRGVIRVVAEKEYPAAETAGAR